MQIVDYIAQARLSKPPCVVELLLRYRGRCWRRLPTVPPCIYADQHVAVGNLVLAH
jgi:hypothetical protein